MKKSTALPAPYLRRIFFQRSNDIENTYPFNLSIFRQDFELNMKRAITIFVGENGSGKSTLLEYIAHACHFNLQGGSQDHLYRTKAREDHSCLERLKSMIRLSWLPRVSQGFFMRAETLFNFLEYIYDPEFSDINYEENYGGYLLEKSHGEAFLSLFEHRFKRGGIYLLDEPEAALSPNRQLEFLKVLRAMERRQDTQVIMITHSPILMSYPGADLFLFSKEGINPCHLEEIENYRLMKDFLQNPDLYLHDLMEE